MKLFDSLHKSVRALAREVKSAHVPPLLDAPKPCRIGLALGGGFARGLAHVGVLKALDEEGITPDFIAGTSVGAVIGAAYCSGVSAKELEEIAAIVRFKDFARYTISRFGLCTNDRMTGFLQRILKVKTFEQLRIPLAVTATDFLTGEPVVFTRGDLVDPVRASCAYPGVFLPVNVNGKVMVDGLLGHAVPARPLKEMGADRVAAVYFGAHWVHRYPRHVLEVIGQCFSIVQANMSCLWRAHADLLVEPDVSTYSFDDFHKALGIVKVGYEAGVNALPTFRAWAAEREAYRKHCQEIQQKNLTIAPTAAISQQPVPLG
ncbi:MAG TPA: patatin-like phospholipase family protein [Terriglobales bacterium]|nr:patatin-like phospholipase family protein [Terriglobales bacterium]